MSDFPQPVLDYWHRTFAADNASVHGTLAFAVSATLNPKRPAMMLERQDGSVHAAVRPEIAERLIGMEWDGCSADLFKRRCEAVGVMLHDTDYLFYLPAISGNESDGRLSPRRLTEADRTVFDIFYHTASEQDREDAWVELDHWAVFGCFDGDRLVSATSMNLWNDGPIADLGVLTLPDARGKGCARAVVEAINRYTRQQGREPQYRCQLDNVASVALARSCGFALLGQWVVAADRP